jgi:ATP phosphoribosyltransferase
MEQILSLLQGTLVARSRVLVKLNVAAEYLDAIIALVPAMRSPTVSKLFSDDGYAVEAVVPKETINILIPALKDQGATDILELALSKIVH